MVLCRLDLPTQNLFANWNTQGVLCMAIQIPDSGKFLLMEGGIVGYGIRNSALEIRNPTNDYQRSWNSSW